MFYILAAVHCSKPVLAACWFCSFWTCTRASSYSCCNYSNWARRPWNSALPEVGPWPHVGALHFQRYGWNCRGMPQITAFELLLVDRAAANDGREHVNNAGSSLCGNSCQCSELKRDLEQLSGVSATSSAAFLTVCSGGRTIS